MGRALRTVLDIGVNVAFTYLNQRTFLHVNKNVLPRGPVHDPGRPLFHPSYFSKTKNSFERDLLLEVNKYFASYKDLRGLILFIYLI